MINERLSETAEDICLLFEQAVVEYQREVDRLRNVSDAKQVEIPQWSLHVAQKTPTVDQEEPADVLSNKENTGYFPCEVKTEQSHVTQEDGPQMLITNIKSLFNGDELEPRGQQQKANSKEPEEDSDRGSDEEHPLRSVAPRKWFSCTVCKRGFSQIKGVQLHMRMAHPGEKPHFSHTRKTHLTNKPFKCSVCHLVCKSQSNLKIHMRIHTGERPFVCSVCGKGFTISANLKKHMETHSRNKLFSCTKCGVKYRSQQSLQYHLCTYVEEHAVAVLDKEKTGSSQCKAETEQVMIMQEEEPQNLTTNVESLNNGDELQPSGQQQKANSEKPEEEVSPESNPVPEEEDSDTDSNEEHPFGSNAPKKPFSCPVCKRDFTQFRGVTMHMRRVHPGEKPLWTRWASAVYNAHLDSERPSPNMDILCRPFSCKVCHRRFKRRSSLEEHMRAHAKENPSTCKECGMSFPNQFSVTRHIRKVHSTDTPYKCSICYIACRGPSLLKVHMLSHTGQRPFVCSLCGKGFTVRTGLKRHMGSHSGEKPFSCKKCGKNYTSKQNVMIHMRVHR